MNRIYQGRVTKVEILNGKNADGQPQWHLLGFTPDEAERLEKERERLRPLTKEDSPEGENARKRLADINRRLNEPWQTALWQHHELFQDAVNYYIVALASLGRSPDSPLTKLSSRISAVWASVEKQGQLREGMGASLAKRFGFPVHEASLSRIMETVHDGGLPDAEAAEKAGELILEKAKGASGIQQQGPVFWPQLCNPNFTRRGNLAGGAADKLKAQGTFMLSTRLHEIKTRAEMKEFAKQCHLGWVVKTNPAGATHGDSKARLRDSVIHFLKLYEDSLAKESTNKNRPDTVDWLKGQANAEGELRSLLTGVEKSQNLAPILRNNRGPDADKTEALLLFQFKSGEFTAGLLKHLFPHDPEAQSPSEATGESDGGVVARARGARGYLIRAFSSFPFFGGKSSADFESSGWGAAFDIAAFKEALTIVSQFNKNDADRKAKTKDRATRLLMMAGETVIGEYSGQSDVDEPIRHQLQTIWKESKGKPKLEAPATSGSNEDSQIPNFLGDPRIARLREIVNKDLAEEYRLTEGRDTPYGLRRRTMKGWSDVRRKWQTIVKAGASFSEAKKEKLQKALDDLRTDKPEQIGSHRLYEALITSEESWRIWREPTDEEAEQIVRRGWASDPLESFRIYCETKETLEDLVRRKLNFTPADARHSRRLFSFTDACSSFGNPGGEFKHDPKALAVTVPISAINAQGRFERTTIRAIYAAPRMLRDQIRAMDGRYVQRWVQPMVAALCPATTSLPTQKELAAAAVELMPDWDKDDQRRFLLNFALDLSPVDLWKRIYELRGQAQQFGTRFSPRDRKRETPLHAGLWEASIRTFWEGDAPRLRDVLLWPTDSFKKQAWHPAPWWEQVNSFRVLSGDLGTRHAAIIALVEASAGEPDKPSTARFIGEAGGRKWFAQYRTGKILRLPGEDGQSYRHQTRLDVERGESPLDRKHDKAFREELHGARGRLAGDDETKQFRNIVRDLGYEDLLPEACRPETALPRLRSQFSFPEQNDKLLVALRWAQRHIADLISQHWRLVKPEKPAQTAVALKELREQKRYPEVAKMAADPAQADELIRFVHSRITELRQVVQEHLLALTGRILPLRERSWEFVAHPQTDHFSGCHLLQPTDRGTGSKNKKLPGQRGLSMARIEQLSELRRRWQSLNQSLRRPIGEPPLTAAEMRANPIPDPCPHILRKLDDIREQRVNQTAHLILAEALGVRLIAPEKDPREREEADIHGEYVSLRPPVDFIVLENLDRYKAAQGRAKSENSRLMQWCHRAVVDKIKELAEPFGIPVLETPAAYSSRFCSLTGIAGFRAVEVGLADRDDYRWRKLLREADERGEVASDGAKAARRLFSSLEQANAGRVGKQLRTLLAPQVGGPIFVTATAVPHPTARNEHKSSPTLVPPMQSDLNAAINLALRGMAHPDRADIHHRVRTERVNPKEANQKQIAASSVFRTREKRRFGEQQPQIVTAPGDSLPRERNSNLFYDPWSVALFGRARWDSEPEGSFSYASGPGLWKRVNDSAFQWQRCEEINRQRMERLGFKATSKAQVRGLEAEEDDISM